MTATPSKVRTQDNVKATYSLSAQQTQRYTGPYTQTGGFQAADTAPRANPLSLSGSTVGFAKDTGNANVLFLTPLVVADGETATMRVTLWFPIYEDPDANGQEAIDAFSPITYEFTLTGGTLDAAGDAHSTDGLNYCKTITEDVGPGSPDVRVFSSGSAAFPSWIAVDVHGASAYQVTFNRGTTAKCGTFYGTE